MDIWNFAIKMENDGEEYYRKQAEKNKGGKMEVVFYSLAEDEKIHANILEKKRDQVDYTLEESNVAEYSNVFDKEEEFKIEIKPDPKQIDFYRLALEKEQESIDLYKKMMDESEESDEKDLFSWLIEQEKMHHKLLYDLITLLEKPESWVEDAEFGIREDY